MGPARSGPEGTWAGHLTWVSSRETRLATGPPHVCPWTRQCLDGHWEGPGKIPGPQASHSSTPLPSYPTPSPATRTCLLQGYPPGWGVEQTPGGSPKAPVPSTAVTHTPHTPLFSTETRASCSQGTWDVHSHGGQKPHLVHGAGTGTRPMPADSQPSYSTARGPWGLAWGTSVRWPPLPSF
ncbi:hypothetical protein mRhiFer1_009269 [Rhinolophus ferrumequinum]|uniref:Uncharacterized protein n=1 Tax=Rhinolophus ferrumequinum TaxID=59479 RepID=A0A7J7S7V1_RHIFE|nr:hypothetical protein mRhiFer1_009269 [Rhinolophus ferrumequinum]